MEEVAAPLLMWEELPPGEEDGVRGAESLDLNRPDLQLSGETTSIHQLLGLTDPSEWLRKTDLSVG